MIQNTNKKIYVSYKERQCSWISTFQLKEKKIIITIEISCQLPSLPHSEVTTVSDCDMRRPLLFFPSLTVYACIPKQYYILLTLKMLYTWTHVFFLFLISKLFPCSFKLLHTSIIHQFLLLYSIPL